jgi:pyruvate/2-oxoglutarate dehydrogenase complex dihydrolipoamide dehydrogenase (E3) component
LAGREDPDVAAALLDVFRDEGIEVLLRTEVQRVTGRSGQQIEVSVDDGTGARIFDATDLLVGTGRTPNTHGIGLELAAVDLDARGYVKVDERLETSAANVWAMGDCAGSPQFTHVSFDDFRVVCDNLSGGNRTTSNRLVPFCMFTDPELARVGLNEVEARARGIPYRLASLPMTAVLRTRTTSEPRGFMKMLIDMDTDGILGFMVLSDEASELMATVQSAMLGHQPYTMLRDGIFTHPTAAEGLTVLLAGVPQVGVSSAVSRAPAAVSRAPA